MALPHRLRGKRHLLEASTDEMPLKIIRIGGFGYYEVATVLEKLPTGKNKWRRIWQLGVDSEDELKALGIEPIEECEPPQIKDGYDISNETIEATHR
ncbi:hypothetical protein ACFSJY_04030 [Thalassotalea euphylliae]|uniref:hypothetical protein n=1 Tax=Thalassotalea euphylliae TaxID=1655234 RepID=UPI00363FF0CC